MINLIRKEDLDALSKFIIENLQAELEAQGHNATGHLSDSMTSKNIIEVGVKILQIEAEDYVESVDKGQPKGTVVPLEDLMEWVQVKAIASGDYLVRGIAEAIKLAIFREGTPTSGSLRFSSTGKRTEFIAESLERIEFEIITMLEDRFVSNSKDLIDELISSKKLDNI